MACKAATASTVVILLLAAAAAAASTSTADEALLLPRRLSASSVSPPRRPLNWPTPVWVSPPRPSSKQPTAPVWVSPPRRSSKQPTAPVWVSPPRPSSNWPTAPAWVSPPRALAPSPPAGTTCVTALLDLSPCLPFFKDTGATAAPAGCCEGLRAIVDTQAMCLCHIVNHSLERAIGVDIPIARALHLLGDICGLALPPEVISSCGNKDRVPPLYACPAPAV